MKYETWSDRRRNLEAHVIRRVGGVALQEFNAAHLNRLYADLLRDGLVSGDGACPPRPCGASTPCCARPSTTRSAGVASSATL